MHLKFEICESECARLVISSRRSHWRSFHGTSNGEHRQRDQPPPVMSGVRHAVVIISRWSKTSNIQSSSSLQFVYLFTLPDGLRWHNLQRLSSTNRCHVCEDMMLHLFAHMLSSVLVTFKRLFGESRQVMLHSHTRPERIQNINVDVERPNTLTMR